MKKKIKYLLFIILCNIFMMNVYAASATISVTPSARKVQVGQTFTVNVTLSSAKALGSWQFNVGYDSNVFQYVSSNMESGLTSVGFVSNDKTKNKTYRLTFKAKKEGAGSITVNNVEAYSFDEELLNTSKASTTITVENPTPKSNIFSNKTSNAKENNKSESADNYLSSLSIDGYNLSPKFDKNTTTYTLSLPNNVNSINVSAKTNDSKASVSGTGKIGVKEGINKIYLTVTAENGNRKTYTLKVTVQEKDPIKVKIGDEEYTVAQKMEKEAPSTYIDSTVLIDGSEVPAYKSSVSSYTLVGLISKNGNFDLYIYDNDKYELYREYKFNGITLYIKEPNELPKGAKENKITINGDSIKSYNIKDNSYPLIYGMNVETGDENFYTYDSSENTLQKYVVGNKNTTNEVTQISSNISYVAADDKFETLAYILCGLTGMLFVFLGISAVKMSIQNEYKIRG